METAATRGVDLSGWLGFLGDDKIISEDFALMKSGPSSSQSILGAIVFTDISYSVFEAMGSLLTLKVLEQGNLIKLAAMRDLCGVAIKKFRVRLRLSVSWRGNVLDLQPWRAMMTSITNGALFNGVPRLARQPRPTCGCSHLASDGGFVKIDKLQNLAGQHSDVLENLTPTVRKRIEVLRGIQVLNFLMFKSYLRLSMLRISEAAPPPVVAKIVVTGSLFPFLNSYLDGMCYSHTRCDNQGRA
ncbi:hypothetical protein Tco_0431351, partial [Tanacetum coccineum]